MRELKFRAWGKKDNKMMHGCQGLVLSMDGFFGYWVHDEFTVLDYPIMLYTGLKDKSGKEIYEGDILYSYYGTGQVVYEYGSYLLNFGSLKSIHKSFRNYVEFTEIQDNSSLLGNIYENPELLKEK